MLCMHGCMVPLGPSSVSWPRNLSESKEKERSLSKEVDYESGEILRYKIVKDTISLHEGERKLFFAVSKEIGYPELEMKERYREDVFEETVLRRAVRTKDLKSWQWSVLVLLSGLAAYSLASANALNKEGEKFGYGYGVSYLAALTGGLYLFSNPYTRTTGLQRKEDEVVDSFRIITDHVIKDEPAVQTGFYLSAPYEIFYTGKGRTEAIIMETGSEGTLWVDLKPAPGFFLRRQGAENASMDEIPVMAEIVPGLRRSPEWRQCVKPFIQEKEVYLQLKPVEDRGLESDLKIPVTLYFWTQESVEKGCSTYILKILNQKIKDVSFHVIDKIEKVAIQARLEIKVSSPRAGEILSGLFGAKTSRKYLDQVKHYFRGRKIIDPVDRTMVLPLYRDACILTYTASCAGYIPREGVIRGIVQNKIVIELEKE